MVEKLQKKHQQRWKDITVDFMTEETISSVMNLGMPSDNTNRNGDSMVTNVSIIFMINGFVFVELNSLCAKIDAVQQELEKSGFKSKPRVVGEASVLPIPPNPLEWTVKREYQHQISISSSPAAACNAQLKDY